MKKKFEFTMPGDNKIVICLVIQDIKTKKNFLLWKNCNEIEKNPKTIIKNKIRHYKQELKKLEKALEYFE